MSADDRTGELMEAVRADDAASVRQLLKEYPSLRKRVNDPIGPFDSPPLNSARSREMIDALLDAGADVNAKSQWWAGGFGLLHSASPELAAHAVERGAEVDIHAASRLGLFDRVRELVERDPQLVHARGGDGQTPLHFAKTVEIASYLLAHGADIDAKDIDHESTPAQYMLDNRPEVARYLVERGCRTDILLASAVGDIKRVGALLDVDPECVRVRGNQQFFPMENKKAGGIIYQWTLGPNASPFQAAAKFGHHDVIRLLMDRSPAQERLIALCWMHDAPAVADLVARNPGLADRFSDADRNEIASAARNNDTEAVRLMLEVGLPVTAKGQHRGTPLHWAAWHGNLAMVKALLSHGPSLENAENDFQATPFGWATHGSEHGWNCETGDYPGVVEALLAAGSKLFETARGTESVKNVQRRYGAKG
jgi:ankyrin repeat protein